MNYIYFFTKIEKINKNKTKNKTIFKNQKNLTIKKIFKVQEI